MIGWLAAVCVVETSAHLPAHSLLAGLQCSFDHNLKRLIWSLLPSADPRDVLPSRAFDKIKLSFAKFIGLRQCLVSLASNAPVLHRLS